MKKQGGSRNEEIEAGAHTLLEDYWLPGGEPKGIATWVEDNLTWFDDAKSRGMKLPAIRRLFKNLGLEINRSALSVALSRKRKAEPVSRREQTTVKSKGPKPGSSPPKTSSHSRHSKPVDVRAEQAPKSKRSSSRNQVKEPPDSSRLSQDVAKKGLRGFMDRARTLRNRYRDD